MEEKKPDFRKKKKNTKIIKIYKSFTNVMYTLYSNNTYTTNNFGWNNF